MTQEPTKREKIGIVGLGLIGGSLGLALQSIGYEVHGLTHKRNSATKAKKGKLASIVSTEADILRDCDLIFLALPINQLLDPSKKLIASLPKDCIVTDVGSVKVPIVKVWEKIHPLFVGSHPMAGSNNSGVEAGDKNLFRHKIWVTTPTQNTSTEALGFVNQLVSSIGCKLLCTDAKTHDQAVSLISHLPVLVSAALLKTAMREKNSRVLDLAKKLASTGFSDTSRVGGGNPELGVSMAANNTTEILKSLIGYRDSLNLIIDTVSKKDWINLKKELESTQQSRNDFIDD